MEVHRNGLEELEILVRYFRPVAIFVGLSVFLLGAIVLGAALAASHPPRAYLFAGSILLSIGVSLLGGSLITEPSGYWLDPDIEFTGTQRYVVAGLSVLFLLLAALTALLGG